MGSAAALMSGVGAFFLNAVRSASASTIISTDPVHHFLNRISWSVTPEALERARSMGIPAYLEEQLNPNQIKDKVKINKLFSLDRDKLRSMKKSNSKCHEALIQTMIARAVFSKRQLLDRMVEFWSDHFNIASEELEPELIGFQRDVIRAHALGNFHDLLVATAQSPAMLFYLDNYLNVKDAPQENYARELMELHTLGVDGGYKEADVKAVARAFTGWTVYDEAGGFYFDPYEHDTDAKVVLGATLPAGRGIEDGMDVLNVLAAHPNTALYLSGKLCVRFVSDNPPQSLVDSTAAVWMQTNGDIKSVLRHIFLSQEFAGSAGQKLRRPLEFFISALRATGTESKEEDYFDSLLERLAQTPYAWPTPDGYPDVGARWMSTNGLLQRWNISMRLTEDALNKRHAMKTAITKKIGKPDTVGELVDNAALAVFGTTLPADVRAEMVSFVADGGLAGAPVTPEILEQKLGSLFGLLLGSPQNQWR